MNIFEEYLKSDFVKEELKKIAAEEEEVPKAPTKYGAIFRTVLDSSTGAVEISFYLRAGVIIETEKGEKIVNKENVYKYIKSLKPDWPTEKIFRVMQDIMMSPRTEKIFRKETKRSPLHVYTTTLNLPQFKGKDISQIQTFLLQLLRNGVFDPILRARDKTSTEIAELGARLKDVEVTHTTGESLKEYKEEELKPQRLDEEFFKQQLGSLIQKLIKTAGNEAWWFINETDMLIRGPFPSIEATIRAQDLEEGFEIEEETLEIPEEELVMANKEMLGKLAVLADKLDEKNESKFAEQLDELIKTACYDVTPSYDAVKDFHPKGGFTTQLDNKVKGDGAKTETITEQQKKDLEVATAKPTGELSSITASCGKCGLTQIAYYVEECPGCSTPILRRKPSETADEYAKRLNEDTAKKQEEKALDTMQEQRVMV